MTQSDGLGELERAFATRGWDPALVGRAMELRFPRDVLRRWTEDQWPTAEYVARRLAGHERLTRGDLRGREATRFDNEAFSELWANSPEELGEWR
jgi:hypothetical protein